MVFMAMPPAALLHISSHRKQESVNLHKGSQAYLSTDQLRWCVPTKNDKAIPPTDHPTRPLHVTKVIAHFSLPPLIVGILRLISYIIR